MEAWLWFEDESDRGVVGVGDRQKEGRDAAHGGGSQTLPHDGPSPWALPTLLCLGRVC